jgi:acetaldehyde dehydrogenase (acetylating)
MLQDQDLIAVQEARTKVEAAHSAWGKYRNFTQEQIDAVVEAVAKAGQDNARRLAEMAVEETGMGNVEDKVAKNLLNADYLPRKMRGMKTVGVLRELPEERVTEIGVPVGVIGAIVPTTNPTSTVIYKTLISLKAGNGVVLSPHPRAKNCSNYTAELLYQAAVKAGAPEGIVQCLSNVTQQSTQEVMQHKRTALILATGGHGLVKAAYSSGKPALGVGPGNVPVLLEKSFDVGTAIEKVVQGKSFDYGTVCSSEQTVVTCCDLKPKVLEELKRNKAYLATDAEAEKLGKLLINAKGIVNAACVGQSPQRIAEMAGIQIPADTSIIATEIKGVGLDHPLSAEKLSPVLALYFGKDFHDAMNTCEAILRFGGLGHTCVIFSNDDARVREFGLRMPAYRVLVNTPAPQGSVGITTNVFPAMTLGCGAAAGNATSDNVGPQHLINIKRIAYAVRTPEEAFAPENGASPVSTPAPSITPSRAPAPRSQGMAAQTVEAVVERYLQQRGLAPSAPVAPPPAATPRVHVSALVVDRFLAGRVGPSAPSCGCGAPTVAATSAPQTPAPPPAPEPPIQIVDFVCEQDVREAIAESRKIFIGPKTIVTPSARETASPGDILVLAERPD